MTDQQRADSIAPYRRAHTPNVDRLGKEGVTFSQTYCPSPHCCPSRASFFTGLYPSEHGVRNNVDVGNALSRGPFPGTRLFSDDLKDAGYELYFSGKWHVSSLDTPADRGWTMTPTQLVLLPDIIDCHSQIVCCSSDGAIDLTRSYETSVPWNVAAWDLRPEDAIAGITEAGEDVPFFVELPVDGGAVEGDFGMKLVEMRNAFRGGDETDESHVGHAGIFEE